MTKEELITKQQLKIEDLKEELKNSKDAMENINSILFSVGGLLNDRSIGMNKEQLDLLRQISGITDIYI